MSRLVLPMLAALAALSVAPALAAGANDTAHSSWSDFPVKADPSIKDPLVRQGQELFRARCGACHGPIPPGMTGGGGISPMAGTQSLQVKYKGSKPAALEQRRDLTAEQVKFFVRHGPGFMPSFRPTELTDQELDAVSAYVARKRK